jgi:hypothetical protein
MATEALKSTTITNLDASPIVTPALGEGGPGFVRSVSETITTTSGVTSGSTYRFVRVPSNAKIKFVGMRNAAMTAGTADLDIAHSDSTTDGTQPSLQGTIPQVSSADNKLFGSALSWASASTGNGFVEETFANAFLPKHLNMPLWAVLNDLGATGYTADPGGFFDFVFKTTATITTGAAVTLKVDYEE